MSHMRKMKLITKALEKQLPPLRSQDGKVYDALAIVKIFDPCSQWTWFATEYDPQERMFFGLVIGHEKELGYFSLTELESVRNRWGLPLERDLHFKPTPLKEVR